MPRLIYIDTMRMVSPGSALEDNHFDYYLLGSFDAMKIVTEKIDSFVEFQNISRKRHREVPVRYDKQPMCLYWENDDDHSISVFQNDGGYESKPLVMTLVQLHDEILNVDSPTLLINKFRMHILNIIESEESFKGIEFSVFYSLGEVDIVLVFRDSSVGNIARLLYRLRTWEETSNDGKQGIRILSICSHCAFPATKEDSDFQKHIHDWMDNEKESNFVTFVDTSYGTENNQTDSRLFRFDKYLLGEYDHMDPWTSNGDDVVDRRTNRYYSEIIQPLRSPNLDHPNHFRTAFTVPVVTLQHSDLPYAKSEHILTTIQTNYDEILSQYEHPTEESIFIKLSKCIRGCAHSKAIFGDVKSVEYLSNKIETMAGTLIGLLKHLIRLKEGRFEGDLYAFVVPAFEAMPKIASSYHSLTLRLMSQYEARYSEYCDDQSEAIKDAMRDLSDRIGSLLNEYIQDASRLVSLLQHLFSILSVSPHTYLETYGSNMRSIAAVCKLLGAYQGISYRLSKDLPMQLDNYDTLNNFVGCESAIETMLILPYRSIRQSTRTLFEHSSPLNRIVSVRLDFADMMDVSRTLYLLLHEIGHHVITPQLRHTRKKTLVTAIFAYLLQHGFGSIYENPYSHMEYPSLLQEDTASAKKIQWVHNDETTSEADIKAVLAEYIGKTALTMYSEFDSEWEEYRMSVSTKEEPVALNNLFSELLKKMLNDFLSRYLGKISKSNGDILIPHDYSYFFYRVYDLCVNGVLKVFKLVIDEQYAVKRHKDDCDLWRLDELCVWYAEATEYSIHIEKIIRSVLAKIEAIYKHAVEEFFTMYSDIYCDIFAFHMLCLDSDGSYTNRRELAEEYVRLYKDMAGFKINVESERVCVLIRLNIILTKCYMIEKTKANKMIVQTLFSDSPLKSKIEELLEAVDTSVYYRYIEKYADACKKSIISSLKEHAPLKKDAEALHSMYMGARKQNISEIVSKIHDFWMASTKRKEETSNEVI